MKLKPAEGLKVRYENPAQGHIPAEGDDLPNTKYYRRLMAAGDLVGVPPKEPPKKEKGS